MFNNLNCFACKQFTHLRHREALKINYQNVCLKTPLSDSSEFIIPNEIDFSEVY